MELRLQTDKTTGEFDGFPGLTNAFTIVSEFIKISFLLLNLTAYRCAFLQRQHLNQTSLAAMFKNWLVL
jgi:hypothetical protein